MEGREVDPLLAAPGDSGGSAQPSTHATATGSHIGSLYPFVQRQADRSPIALSYLRPEFDDLASWQRRARARVFEHMFYQPPPVEPHAHVIRRADRGDYTEEYLTFQTTPDIRVPAYVLVPKNAPLPAPGIVALHDHGGFYLWGKEKLVPSDGEHTALTEFRRVTYGGNSIAVELVRQGYVTIVIDMFYWGERRMLLDDDPPEFRTRPATMSQEQIEEFNRRSRDGEQLVARSLFTAGITWPGVMLWDDLRTLDYLAQRPEVDSTRLACVGLSVGGYRSFMLAALDERIKAAVSVGFMQSYTAQIKQNVINTTGLSFHLVGLFHYLDFPDLAALIAPRALLALNGTQDTLFNQRGLQAAYATIGKCYAKAGIAERQVCRLYDAPHEFNPEMQTDAWSWLRTWL
jgi:dienelactone hydrolase